MNSGFLLKMVVREGDHSLITRLIHETRPSGRRKRRSKTLPAFLSLCPALRAACGCAKRPSCRFVEP
ncbi:hypothetical protein FQ626_10800 [Erwinia pyrifoliae]|nr:hypothetical protein [Erwinia pyrifoliae]